MKTIYKTYAVLITGLLFFAGCDNPFEPTMQKTAGGEGSFSLEIGGTQVGRTIVPATVQNNFQRYDLVFSSSGRDDIPVERTNSNLNDPVSLAAATWNLTVTAYMDSGKTMPVAQGSLTGIVINADENTSRSLELKAIIEEDATGTFSWNITYPSAATIASMTITPLDEQTGTPEQTLFFKGGTPGVTNNNSTSPLSLNTGYYLVTFYLTNGEHVIGREEYLHIYKNLPSQFTCAFTQDHFTVLSVTNGNSSGPGSLYYAIANAASNNTILIEDSVETIALSSRITINKSLIIEGNGVTITRDASWTLTDTSSQLMQITGSSTTVTIRRVHFKDGRATDYGAAINNNGGVLTLESCIFSGNRTSGNAYGGAIYNSGTMNVKGCTFLSNWGNGPGGAIYTSSSSLTLTGNLFYGNYVYRSNGTVTSGGYNVVDVPLGTETDQSGWAAVATDKTISGIQIAPLSFRPLSGSGAANVIAELPSGYPAVDFHGNPITDGAAAGAVQGTAIGYLFDLTNNTPGKGTVEITPQPNADGLYSGTVTITASPAQGYGCYWLVNNTNVGTTNPLELNITAHTRVQVVFARIVNNYTSDARLRSAVTNAVSGDIIFLDGVTPGETTITLSSWLQIGTGLTIEGNGVTITRNTSLNNPLMYISNYNSVTIRRIHFKDGSTASYGGAAIYNTSSLTLESCIFSGNRSNSSNSLGGAIYNYGNTSIKGCTFVSNRSSSYGGAIYNDSNNYNGKLYLTGNLFYGNTTTSTYNGPVVYDSNRMDPWTISFGYNVVDVAMGPGTSQSGWAAGTGDKYINYQLLSTETFQPYAGDVTLNIITTLPDEYPAFDFYGDPIAAGAAAGAVQSTSNDPRPALTGTVSITVPGGDGEPSKVGQTLTANTASLDGSGTISYQWKRADVATAAGANINGATNSTYTVTADDEGSYITVTVSRADNSGSITSESAIQVEGVTPVSFISVNSNNISGNTTELTLTFNRAITGLSANDITISNINGVTITKETLSGPVSNPDETVTYTLPISLSFTANGSSNTTVTVSKAGYDISSTSPRFVYIYRTLPAISLSYVFANGGLNSSTTNQLTLIFSEEIPGLSAADINIGTATGVTSITKGTLSGPTPGEPTPGTIGYYYTLPITVYFTASGSSNASVSVTKAGYTITPSRSVTIYRYAVPVTLNSVTPNGSLTETTTALTLEFSRAIDGLNANYINLSGVTGVTKGTLSGPIGDGPVSYTLPITTSSSGMLTVAISSNDGINLPGYAISGSPKTVPVYCYNLVVGTGLAAKLAWVASSAQSNAEYTLSVDPNENIQPHTLSYSGRTNVTVRLIGGSAGENFIDTSGNGSLFTIESGVTLILEDGVTLRGRDNNNAALVRINGDGKLIMNEGSKITGNNNTSSVFGGGVYIDTNGIFEMTGGEISSNTVSNSDWSYGGGAGVYSGGNFTMTDGKISGNNTTFSSSYRGGAGVFVWDGTFTMNNGEISANTGSNGGGVRVYNGTFTMNNGEISGNTGGGGVHVDSNRTFTMTGGKISDNTSSSYGGGVYAGGTFNMEHGEISGNRGSSGGGVFSSGSFTMANANCVIVNNTTTSYQGGGVYVSGGTFTMNNGEISNNKAANISDWSSAYGGGVYMSSGTFTMNNGKISHNEATNSYSSYSSYGGGVSVSGGNFTMNNGEISNNKAATTTTGSSTYGGGVYVDSSRTFTMKGGVISDNTANSANVANSYGGGVYTSGTFNMESPAVITGNNASSGGGVYGNSGRFTMTSGTISQNTATASGGGVYLYSSGYFVMEGGTISGNTAAVYGGGVYVVYTSSASSFIKSGGTIYGYAGETAANRNTATQGISSNDSGHAAYVSSSPVRRRESTAGTTVLLDSLSQGGWE